MKRLAQYRNTAGIDFRRTSHGARRVAGGSRARWAARMLPGLLIAVGMGSFSAVANDSAESRETAESIEVSGTDIAGNPSAPPRFHLAQVVEEATDAPDADGGRDADADAEPDASSAEEAPEAERSRWVSGSFEAGADAALSRNDTDIDLYQSLRLRLDPPQYENIRVDSWVWMHQDLDSKERRSSVLRDINNAWDSDFRVRLMHLYLELDELWGDSTLRLGRQRIEEGVAFSRIDGGYFKKRFAKGDWYVFLGSRASVYDEHLFEDLIYGGGAAYQLGDATRAALDIYYAEERRRDSENVYRGLIPEVLGLEFPRRVRTRLGDNLYTLSLWQDLGETLRFFGQFSLNNGRADELVLDLTGFALGLDLTYQVTYRGRLQRIEERVTDIAYFYRVLGPYDKFDNFLVAVHKPLTERLTLSLEGEVHDAEDSRLHTANRDYSRYAATLGVKELLPQTDASITLERWSVRGGEGLWAVGGEVKRVWDRFEAAIGLDYQRYKDVLVRYDPVPFAVYTRMVYTIPGLYTGYAPWVRLTDEWAVTTREDIYTAHARVRWTVRENHEVRARLTFEEDEGPQSPYWRLQAEYAIRF